MTAPSMTLREMVFAVLQERNEHPLKPSEIAAIIKDKYPDYCAQKTASTTQENFNVVTQIASQISANGRLWVQRFPQLKSSEETPRTYWMEGADSGDLINFPGQRSEVARVQSGQIDEQGLYPKLAAYLWGMKARKLYPKRIDEKTSSNTNGLNGNKTLHPDVVAMEDLMPQPAWSPEMKEWATRAGAPQVKIWSYEVKIKISSISDARDSYFQALANSAWANYGYLVATHISERALSELKMLVDLHGVGVLLLDVDNPIDESTVKFPARERPDIDWGACNRIASQNSDFRRFVELVADFCVTRKTKARDWDVQDSGVA